MSDKEPRSFYLPDGRIIFPYLCNADFTARKWRIGVRGERGELRAIQWFKPIPGKRYSETESLADLRAYARAHNLEPAY
jgi:hypothetical protein